MKKTKKIVVKFKSKELVQIYLNLFNKITITGYQFLCIFVCLLTLFPQNFPSWNRISKEKWMRIHNHGLNFTFYPSSLGGGGGGRGEWIPKLGWEKWLCACGRHEGYKENKKWKDRNRQKKDNIFFFLVVLYILWPIPVVLLTRERGKG